MANALYIGKPCRHGHDGTRYLKTNECLDCKRAHSKRWKKSESGKKYNREWAKRSYVYHPRDPQTPENKRACNLRYRTRMAVEFRKRWREGYGHLKRYGLSKVEYERMLLDQGGVCAICSSPNGSSKNRRLMCVDHDHVTGNIRGLLCDGCNKGIGCLKDSTELVSKALNYLVRANGG